MQLDHLAPPPPFAGHPFAYPRRESIAYRPQQSIGSRPILSDGAYPMAMAIDPRIQAFRERVGSKLRALREAAELTLDDVGVALGVGKAAVGHWEKGVNPIKLDTLYLLAVKYKTTPAALLSDNGANESGMLISLLHSAQKREQQQAAEQNDSGLSPRAQIRNIIANARPAPPPKPPKRPRKRPPGKGAK